MSTKGLKINKPHYKALHEAALERIAILENDIAHLRANGASDSDLAKIRAESFAAGVASVSLHLLK